MTTQAEIMYHIGTSKCLLEQKNRTSDSLMALILVTLRLRVTRFRSSTLFPENFYPMSRKLIAMISQYHAVNAANWRRQN